MASIYPPNSNSNFIALNFCPTVDSIHYPCSLSDIARVTHHADTTFQVYVVMKAMEGMYALV